jgi:hypothetical protein
MLAAVLSIVFAAAPPDAAQGPTPAKSVHWAYRAPVRPQPTRSGLAPIDALLQPKMERAGLAPRPPADRRTLIRRLALDLTGLPPTLNKKFKSASNSAANLPAVLASFCSTHNFNTI